MYIRKPHKWYDVVGLNEDCRWARRIGEDGRHGRSAQARDALAGLEMRAWARTGLARRSASSGPGSSSGPPSRRTSGIWPTRFRVKAAPTLRRIVIGVDPAASVEREHDVAGIIVVGLGEDGHAYVLLDCSGASGVLTPREWASAAIAAFHR